MLDLTGRVALVTGSTRGIGWRCAGLLAEHGATVVIHGRSELAVAERLADLREIRSGAHTGVVADLVVSDDVQRLTREVFEAHRRLDVLVNNAGVLDDALIGMVTDDAIARTIAVNTIAPIQLTQGAARLMRRAGGGSIVNLTSIIGVVGNRGQIVYSSSKAAVIGLTKSAAKELAPAGVRVNAIAPGFIDTDMANSIPSEVFAERVASIAMGRIGSVDDIANAVLFLASDLSTYVTGQVIGVDGGMLI